MIHIEGMGVIGSILAWRLAEEDVEFTWSDTNAPVAAWWASTGACFPTGDDQDLADLDRWREWHDKPPWPMKVTEPGSWCFTTLRPPHGSRADWMPLTAPWKVSAVASLHVNVSRLVTATRDRMEVRRRFCASVGSRVVVAHGFSERRDRFMWGWAAPVSVALDGEYELSHRPALYHRHVRRFAYAYPIPGRDAWWAGSALVQQRIAKPLDVAAHFERWRRTIEALGIGVERRGAFRQGWRPRGPDDDTQTVRKINGRLVVRPLWHNGVRRAPSVTDAILEAL